MANIYNVNQVAEMLNISVSSIRKLIRENKLKAFKAGNRGYLVNEISLLFFLGHKIEDCINKEDFEKALSMFSKDADGKVDREKFYKYYCSLFIPGPELPYDYFIIKETTKQPKTIHISEPQNEQNPKMEEEQPTSSENNQLYDIAFTKADINGIIEALSKIQEILKQKLI